MSTSPDPRSQNELRALLRTIDEAGWEYAKVEVNGVKLEISKSGNFEPAAGGVTPLEPAPTEREQNTEGAAEKPAPAVAPPVSTPASNATVVTSPTIGLFWRSPKPGSPPFVEVGDTVQEGETVCIVEVMKLMTHVVAPVTGTISAIHIENGASVEHGTALIDIVPANSGE